MSVRKTFHEASPHDKIVAWSTLVMAILTAVMIWLNIDWLVVARNQFYASLEPSLELDITKDGKLMLSIKNSGVPDISDIKLYQILYKFDTNDTLIERKSPLGPSFTLPELRSGAIVNIPTEKYFDAGFVESIQASNNLSRVLCLAVVFRRSIDKHQFIHLEPTYPIVVNGQLGIGFLHQTDWTSWQEKDSSRERQIEQIEEREKLLFRIK
jgi:hypothetical protein